MSASRPNEIRSYATWQEALRAPGLFLLVFGVWALTPYHAGSEPVGQNVTYFAAFAAITTWYAMQYRRAVENVLPIWVMCLLGMLIVCTWTWELTYKSVERAGSRAGGRLGL